MTRSVRMQTYWFHDSDSLRSAASHSLAARLIDAPASLRESVRRSLGLSVELNSDPIRVVHDGRRVGLGSFRVGTETISVAISPKVGIRVKNLVEGLKGTPSWTNLVQLRSSTSAATVVSGTTDFAPAFVLNTLDRIRRYAEQHVDLTHRRHAAFCGWRPRGRPLLAQSLRRLVSGKVDGVICEVPDDQAFSLYADVLCGTAQDIQRRLKKWSDFTLPVSPHVDESVQLILARLGSLRGQGFTLGRMFAAARPPFPFGLRDLLQGCLRYWVGHGEWAPGASAVTAGHWDLGIQLDAMFEAYVGQVFQTALLARGYKWTPSAEYKYRIDGESSDRLLRIDHVFHRLETATRVLVDAKYREPPPGDSELYQMLAYLAHNDPTSANSTRTLGVLVYPGLRWECRRVCGFRHEVHCITVPVNFAADAACAAGWIQETTS